MSESKFNSAAEGTNTKRRRKSRIMTEENAVKQQEENSNLNSEASAQADSDNTSTTTTTIDPEIAEILKFLVPASKLLNNKRSSIPYLVESLFQQSGVVTVAGSSDTGKSSFLRQLATSIILGDADFLGFKINARYNRVIYVSTEDDETNMEFLLFKQNPEVIPEEKSRKLKFIFETSNILKKIESTLRKFSIDCIIIDAFSDLFEGDMNQTNKVRSFLTKFSNLSVKYNTLFIFLHHTGKRTEDLPPSKNNLIGSQGFEAKMRLVIELRKDFSNKQIRHLCIVKGNYLPSEFKDKSYVLRFDENMRFTNLNQRVAFESLGKPSADGNNEAKVKAIAYKRQGLSLNQITERLHSEGLSLSRSTVHNWVKDISSNPTTYGYESDEPESEDNSEEDADD